MENPLMLTFIDPGFLFFRDAIKLKLLLLLLYDQMSHTHRIHSVFKWNPIPKTFNLTNYHHHHRRQHYPKYALFNCDFSFIKVSLVCMFHWYVNVTASKDSTHQVFSINSFSLNEINMKSKQSQIWRTYVIFWFYYKRPVTHNVNLWLTTNVHFSFFAVVVIISHELYYMSYPKKHGPSWKKAGQHFAY